MTATRVITFTGTPSELISYLRDQYLEDWFAGKPEDRETYEWQLTASIAAHPAGKRLGQARGH